MGVETIHFFLRPEKGGSKWRSIYSNLHIVSTLYQHWVFVSKLIQSFGFYSGGGGGGGGGGLTIWRLLYMLRHFDPPFSGNKCYACYAPELSWQAVIAGAEHAKNQYSNHLGPISLSPRWVKPLIKMIYYISGACEKVHRGMKMADIEEVLMDFLKHCPHKKGGPKFKVLSTQTQNVYWSPKMMFF